MRDEFLCVEKTIKLMFSLHGRVFGHSITPADEADGWKALTELKQKRNQLTHPKCADDLEVTHEHARRAIVVFIWMHNCLERIREIENAKWSTLYVELLTEK